MLRHDCRFGCEGSEVLLKLMVRFLRYTQGKAFACVCVEQGFKEFRLGESVCSCQLKRIVRLTQADKVFVLVCVEECRTCQL